jgi:hypothetical protein
MVEKKVIKLHCGVFFLFLDGGFKAWLSSTTWQFSGEMQLSLAHSLTDIPQGSYL